MPSTSGTSTGCVNSTVANRLALEGMCFFATSTARSQLSMYHLHLQPRKALPTMKAPVPAPMSPIDSLCRSPAEGSLSGCFSFELGGLKRQGDRNDERTRSINSSGSGESSTISAAVSASS